MQKNRRKSIKHNTQLGVTPRTPLFKGKKAENQKNVITIRKGRLLLVNDQGFSQIALTSIFPKLPKQIHFFNSREIWLKPKSCFCSIYHNFVINEYFDLKFAVYLAITFHYDVLKGLFHTAVVVGARSRLAFFMIRGDSSHFFHYF